MVLRHLEAFWSEDRALTILLIVLVFVVFVAAPLGIIGPIGGILISLALTLLLVAGVLAVARQRWMVVVGGFVACITLVFDWLSTLHPSREMQIAATVTLIVFLSMLAAVVLARVFGGGPITLHRVIGAVVAYVLLGTIWGESYQLVNLLYPGALVQAGDPRAAMELREFVYFSFVTLSTVGYGDIHAVHPAARSLATLEALTGQLYPAILIARLVSLELATRMSRS